MQAGGSKFAQGQKVCALRSSTERIAAQRLVARAAAETERFRLNNLSPQKGSRRQEKRKGRGYGSGQGGSCGFGMRGQKARSGSGTRPGFEGGQTSLYRRLPKMRGIAGGMPAGLADFNVLNLYDVQEKFSEGEEVSLETLKQKRIFNLSGREARLPLKILGTGDLPFKLTFKAQSFSSSAKAKIEEGGGTVVEVPGKPKWTRKLHNARVAAAEAKGQKLTKKMLPRKAKKAKST